jgi:hypothetical protein
MRVERISRRKEIIDIIFLRLVSYAFVDLAFVMPTPLLGAVDAIWLRLRTTCITLQPEFNALNSNYAPFCKK